MWVQNRFLCIAKVVYNLDKNKFQGAKHKIFLWFLRLFTFKLINNMDNLEKNELIKKEYYPLVFQFLNRVSIYMPVDCKTLEKGDVIADWQRPYPLGDERLIYKGQQNEYEDYISLLCFTESTNYKTDQNGYVWASFQKNKRSSSMHIYILAEVALAYKLHEFQEFETKNLAHDFWENIYQRIKQKLYTY